MSELAEIPEEELEFNDPPRLVFILVENAMGLLWIENPKLHDIGSVVSSIVEHGFQELPKFDVNLPNVGGGKGAIKAGNGRIEALWNMERSGDYELPRGLAKTPGGAWAMPLLIGTDARSLALARAYAVDSNNLTMMGGDGFTVIDQARMWDADRYMSLLGDLSKSNTMPISVSGDDYIFLADALSDFKNYGDNVDTSDATTGLHMHSFYVRSDDFDLLEGVIKHVRDYIVEHELENDITFGVG